MGAVEEQVGIATVRTAIDAGLTLIDTAQAYRTSESVIGRALKDGYRERCFLATKASHDYTRQGIMAAMENSLRNLGVDYVDLYQIHGWNPRYPIEESMETMARLQEAGKTRYIGVSNFNAGQMEQAIAVTGFHSNQLLYNLFDRQIEAQDIPFCERHGIGILSHSSLAKGLLTGHYAPGHKFAADDERSKFPRFQGEVFSHYQALAGRLEQIARGKGLSLIQLAIAWLLRASTVSCVLVGARNPAQVAEYGGALGVTFSADELARIDEVLAEVPRPTTGA